MIAPDSFTVLSHFIARATGQLVEVVRVTDFTPNPKHRGRRPGPVGSAGSKLSRMAKECRIGLRRV